MANDPRTTNLPKLVADHHAELYRYAFRLCGAAEDAEDLTQQTFLVAQQKHKELGQVRNIRAWLYGVLRNLSLKSQRHHRRLVVLPELDLENIPENFPSAAEVDSEHVQAALDKLSPEFRAVVLLFYFEERSYREIAELLDLPIGTVMSRLSRAKGQLRGQLLPEPELEIAGDGRPVLAARPR